MKVKVGQVYDRDRYQHKWIVAGISSGIVRWVICCMNPKTCKSVECNNYIGTRQKNNSFQRAMGLATFEHITKVEKTAYKLNTYETFKNLIQLNDLA